MHSTFIKLGRLYPMASGCLIMRCHNIWLSQINPHAAAFDLQSDTTKAKKNLLTMLLTKIQQFQQPEGNHCSYLLPRQDDRTYRIQVYGPMCHPVSFSEFATCAEFAFFCSGLSHEDIGDHWERGPPLEAAAARVRGFGIDSDGPTGFPESSRNKGIWAAT